MSAPLPSRTIVILGAPVAERAMRLATDRGVRVIATGRYLSPAELEELMQRERPGGVILRLGAIGEGAIRANSDLKIIAKHGVGYDTIDCDAAARAGVIVSVATGANAISVAEHALALMLAVARGIAFLDRRMRDGHWDKANFLGTQLFGKTVGIVGLGAIGTRLATICQGLGMPVIAFDPVAAETPTIVRVGDLPALLGSADIVSLHCPLTPQTRNLISASQIAQMKRTSILINTARGGLVDIDAVVAALQDGRLAGAGLDTFPVEPPALDDVLTSLPNLVISPHVGASTVEAAENVGLLEMQQVLACLSGEPIDANYVVNGVLPTRTMPPITANA